MCEKKKWNKVALENFEVHFFFFLSIVNLNFKRYIDTRYWTIENSKI